MVTVSVAGLEIPQKLRYEHRGVEHGQADHVRLHLTATMEGPEAMKAMRSLVQQMVRERYRFDRLIGASDPMQRTFSLLESAAQNDLPVLVSGETGTGKELAARAIHFNSARRSNDLVAINCAAVPEGLMESELFGHERGSFTGAHTQRKGQFELAGGGTLFLDEVGEMKPAAQTRLLRVLQERVITRVGGVEPIDIDVRVISATNKDLGKAVEHKEFREDLYYRLVVYAIHLPPLPRRAADRRARAGSSRPSGRGPRRSTRAHLPPPRARRRPRRRSSAGRRAGARPTPR